MLDKIKQAKEAVAKFVMKIKSMAKILMTKLGMAVAVVILVCVLAVILYVLIKAMGHFIADLFQDNYAGISTTGDYNYLVSSIGYAGYDSLITEKVWQEFHAYEYAVLMDVAECLYESQEKFYKDNPNPDKSYGPYPSYFDLKNGVAPPPPTEDDKGPVKMKYLPVTCPYNMALLTEEGWRASVIEGQKSARAGFTQVSQITSNSGWAGAGFDTAVTVYGGNGDVMPPTLLYEYKGNPNEPTAGSLIPYIVVLKEKIDFNYYSAGGRGHFNQTNKYNTGVLIDDSNIDLVNLVEFSNKLNAANQNLPMGSEWLKYLANTPSIDPLMSNAAWPEADTDKIDQNLYYTTGNASVVYKTPLSTMIGRYLPKASVLTAWYYVKDNDNAPAETLGKETVDNFIENPFNIDGLMKDIKNVYNYYCWYNGGETLTEEEIKAIKYDSGDGSVIRDKNGKAETYDSTQTVASSNSTTFIEFGQVGLETNRFGLFRPYELRAGSASPSYKNSTEIPIVTELVSKNGYFLDRFGIDAVVEYEYEVEISIPMYKPKEGANVSVEEVKIDTKSHEKDFTIKYGAFAGFKSKGSCSTCNYIANKYKNKIPIYKTSNSIYFVSNFNPDDYDIAFSSSRETRSRDVNVVIPYEATGIYGSTTGKRGYDAGVVAVPEGNFPAGYYANADVAKKASEFINGFVQSGEKIVFNHDPTNNQPQQGFQKGIFNNAAAYQIEGVEKEFVNYEYEYPPYASCVMEKGGVVTAKPQNPDTFGDKKLPFYNVGVAPNGQSQPLGVNDTLGYLSDAILEVMQTQYKDDDSSELFQVLPYLMDVNDPALKQQVLNKNEKLLNGTPKIIKKINGYSSETQNSVYNAPKYTSIYEQEGEGKAVFDIDKYDFVLKLDIHMKRVGAVFVTNAETWAKSLDVKITIRQDMFDYTNYRYVVPHSHFNFGLVSLNLVEHSNYRVDYYKEYFSTFDSKNSKNKNPGIKENDVLTMMMQWEEYGRAGNEDAYAFMRDLYKLIMLNRQKGIELKEAGDEAYKEYILDGAYSYFYIPETIWGFDDTITQRAYWTERLASEVTGDDALTLEEQATVKTRKDVLRWQNVDYTSYKECENPDGTYKVYALFPFGAPYTRTYYMTEALESGKFNDGGFCPGHRGADWYSRAVITRMTWYQAKSGIDYQNHKGYKDPKLDKDSIRARNIYMYEWKARTLQKLLGDSRLDFTQNKKNLISTFINAILKKKIIPIDSISDNTVKTAYKTAQEELNKELREYQIRSPEVAVAPGVVRRADYNCYSGFFVSLKHHREDANHKATTAYCHMRRWPNVQEGDIVGAGTILGYEGTTGRSGGYHLHQGISIDGASRSPSAYMAPIFTPFYNSNKIHETVAKMNISSTGLPDIAILASDYYSLERTVLMQEFDEEGKALYGDVSMDNNEFGSLSVSVKEAPPTYFTTSQFYMINGQEYINFDSKEIQEKAVSFYKDDTELYGNNKHEITISEADYDGFGEPEKFIIEDEASLEGPIYSQVTAISRLQKGPKADNRFIVKVGESDPKFYECKIEEEYIYEPRSGESGDILVDSYDEPDEDDINYLEKVDFYLNNMDYYSGSRKVDVRYKVLEKEEIDYDESHLNAKINITVDVGISDVADVYWGNNVPLLPLFEDSSDLIDIGGLLSEQIYDPANYPNDKHSGSKDPDKNNKTYKDVTASKDLFSATACLDKIALPSHLIYYDFYYPSPLAVHVYEGQVGKWQNGKIIDGGPGSSSGDVIALKLAFRAAGLDPEHKLVFDGVFSDELEEIIKGRLLTDTAIPKFGFLKDGKLGDPEDPSNYSVEGVTNWNAVVTYGSITKAQEAGRNAAKYGAQMNGILPSLALGVAESESSCNPESESKEFCSGAAGRRWTSLPIFPDETSQTNDTIEKQVNDSGATIKYKDVEKTMRRAQGLMQLSPGIALKYARRHVGVDDINIIMNKIKSPRGNALMAGEYLKSNIVKIRGSSEYQRLLSIVYGSNQKHFDKIGEKCGLPSIEVALAACSAYMYNKGPSNDSMKNIITAMEYLRCDDNGNVTYESGYTGSTGYTLKVISIILENEKVATP